MQTAIRTAPAPPRPFGPRASREGAREGGSYPTLVHGSGDVLRALGVSVGFQRPLLSASQLNTFRDCQRRWAFEYVWQLPREANEAALLGRAVHDLLERWSRHGTPPDRSTREGLIALKMLKGLPPPGVGEPERQFYLTTPRHAYVGFIDLVYWSSELGAVIVDHKTTSDLKWAKTAEILSMDAQALIYAAAACVAFRVDEVNLFWNYGTTGSKPRTLEVHTKLRLPQIRKGFESIERDTDTIVELQQKRVHPFSLPPTVDSCEKYGGCPHRERCALTLEEKVKAMMTQDQARANGLLGVMGQLDAYQQGAQPQQPQQPPGYSQQVYYPPQQQQFDYPSQPQQPQYAPQAQPQYVQPQQSQYAPQYALPQQPQYAPPPQQQHAPQQNAPQSQQELEAPRRPSARYQGPSSPPNAPEAQVQHNVTEQQQSQENERKRGRPRKTTKAELSVEQHAFLAGVSAGIMRGATQPSDLRALGRAALAAFLEEFPHEG